MNHTFIYRSDEQNTRIILSLNPDLKFIRIQMGLKDKAREKKCLYCHKKGRHKSVNYYRKKYLFVFYTIEKTQFKVTNI